MLIAKLTKGRFEDQGLIGFGETVDVSLPYEEWKERTANLGKGGNGSYMIVDNSLLLNYDDGRKKQLLIYILEEEVKKSIPQFNYRWRITAHTC